MKHESFLTRRTSRSAKRRRFQEGAAELKRLNL